MKTDIVGLTGHRPNNFSASQRDYLKEELARIIDKLEPEIAISGLALGSDTWWAEQALLKGVDLHVYVPCIDQPSKWHDEDKMRWETMLTSAEKVFLAGFYPATLEAIDGHPQTRIQVMKREYADHTYNVKAMMNRNKAMIDNSDIMIVVWNQDEKKRGGGTKQAWDHIKEKNKPHVVIDFTTKKPKTTIVREKE